MKHAVVVLGILASSILALSCKDNLKSQAREIISHYTGKTILFPDGLQYRSITDPACPLPQNKLKLIVYINGECGACMEQFIQWNQIIEQLANQGDVNIVFYVRAMDAYAIVPHLRSLDFKHPFFIDPQSDILYLNHIPENKRLAHTFLLDKNNEIVLVGSPINNPKLLELYKQQIRELTAQD